MSNVLSADPQTEDEAVSGLVLGIERSVAGRRWLWRRKPTVASEREALALAQRHGVPGVVASMMAARGIGLEDAENFLNPTLRALMPDPSRLTDMDKAAARLAEAVQRGERIGILGDYDVDGATSTALLKRYFNALGIDADIHIPDRIEEGYGPNLPALQGLKSRGAGLILTVDCGSTAIEVLETAAGEGMEIIVLDHHEVEAALPRVFAIVNPNRHDDTSGLGSLCAVGVSFLTLVAVNRCLRQAGFFAEGRSEPGLMGWLDLVALGTVCDVVPLLGLNRALVSQGLRVIAGRGNPGLAALADVAGVSEKPGAYHLGFILGPRVNAGGRVGRAASGSRLLSSDDPAEVRALAAELDALNGQRKEIEQAVLAEAREQAEAAEAAAPDVPLVIVSGEAWHPGVIGIVASRIKDQSGKPSLAIAFDGEIGKGSGRSVPGVDLGSAILAARQAGLLLAGGGHAMAAGLTVERAQLPALTVFLTEHLSRQLSGTVPQPGIEIDGVIGAQAATADLANTLQRLAPFGTANSEPRFVLSNARIVAPAIVGGSHVRCMIADTASGGRLKAIAFRCADSELGARLLGASSAPVHVAGHLRLDSWNGRESAQFVIEDVAEVWAGSTV